MCPEENVCQRMPAVSKTGNFNQSALPAVWKPGSNAGPMSTTAPATTAATSAAMIAYSTAVPPDSLSAQTLSRASRGQFESLELTSRSRRYEREGIFAWESDKLLDWDQ